MMDFMRIIKATPLLALVVVLLLVMAPTTPNEGSTDAVLSVGQVEGDRGGEVIVPVNLAGNTGFACAQFHLEYDGTLLEYKEVAVGETYADQFLEVFKATPSGTGEASKLKIELLMEDPDDKLKVVDVTGDGVLLNVTFKVLSTEKDGCTVTPVVGDRDFFADKDDRDMGIVCRTGSFSIATYDILFMCEGREFSRQVLHLGETIVKPTGTPVKGEDEGHTYTFSHWDGFTEGMKVDGDETFDAVFDSDAKTYTVTWVDGTTEDSEILAYGSAIVAPKDPVKEPTADKVFTFKEWSGYTKGMTVTGDVTFTAVFTDSVRTYQIIFKNGDAVMQDTPFPYGGKPVYSGETPVRNQDERFRYEFKGWGEIAKVDGPATYEAQFDSIPREYKVEWTVDGTVVRTDVLEYGAEMVAPADPVKEPTADKVFAFKEWSGYTDGMTVKKDVSFAAVFTDSARMYDVVFMNGDVEFHASKQAYGTGIVLPVDSPEKASDGMNHYVFDSWKGYTKGMTVSGGHVFAAVFKPVANVYEVVYKIDGKTYATQKYGYNDVIELPADPVKGPTVDKVFAFKEWSGYTEGMRVAESVTFDAVFEESVRKYTVSWSVDGRVTDVPMGYGAAIEAPEDPVKASTESTVYSFREWKGYQKDMTVTGDVTFTAVFDEAPVMHDVVFMNGEVEFHVSEQAYGTVIVLPVDQPEKASDGMNHYVFDSWKGYTKGMTVSGGHVFEAVFKPVANVYDIVFKVDGDTVSERSYGYGDVIVAPADPVKGSTVDKVFTFKGWNGYADGMTVSSDASFEAVFEESVRDYAVRFMDGETVLSEGRVPYGTVPAYDGPTPVRESDAQYTYTFAGWDPEPVPVVGDADYMAVFDSTVNGYTVKWIVDGSEESQVLPYGTPIVAPADPVVEGMVFKGWDGYVKGTVVTGDVTFTAMFGEGVRYHTVTFMNGDEVVDSREMRYGDRIRAPAAPSKEPTDLIVYTFSHWSGYTDRMKVESDMVFFAVFDESDRTYALNFNTAGGNRIPVQNVVPGTPITVPADPVRKEFAFTGWDSEIPEVMPVGDVTVTATWYWIGDKTGDVDIGKKHEVHVKEDNRVHHEDVKETVDNAERGDVISVKPVEKDLEVDMEVVESLVGSGVGLEVVVEDVSVRYPAKVFEDMTGSDVRVKVEKEPEMNDNQKEKVGDRYVLSLEVSSGEERRHELGAVVTIAIQYTLRDGQTPENVVVFYIDDEGNETRKPTKYDEHSRTLYFDTDHHSVFYVGEEESSDDGMIWIAVGLGCAVAVIAVLAYVYTRRS